MLYYGFFDAINGDRKYNSKDFSDYFDGIISDGIYAAVGKAFNVSADGMGLFVNVDTGRAKILNRYVCNTSILRLDISAPDSSNYRYDAIIVRVSLDDRTGSIEVLTGTASTDPQKPTPTDTETKKSYVLAYVKVPPQATAIVPENVENNRGSANCPWVAGLVDTSNIIAQHEESLTRTRMQIDELVHNTQNELTQMESNTSQFVSESETTFNQFMNDSKAKMQEQTESFETWWNDAKARPQTVQSYSFSKTATTDGQTDFEIPQDFKFDIEKHTITVYKNGLHLMYGRDYYVENLAFPQIIRLYSGASVGDIIDYDVIKIV